MKTEQYTEDPPVSYGTARLAREKGYTGKIGTGFRNNSGNYYNYKGELNGDCTDYIRDLIRSKKDDYKPANANISAPSANVLAKWLRDIHHIEISITLLGAESYEVHVFKDRSIIDRIEIWPTPENIKRGIHEDATEKGVQIGLYNIQNQLDGN